MASRVELVFEKVATLPQAKTTPQINPVPPKSNPGHGGRLRLDGIGTYGVAGCGGSPAGGGSSDGRYGCLGGSPAGGTETG